MLWVWIWIGLGILLLPAAGIGIIFLAIGGWLWWSKSKKPSQKYQNPKNEKDLELLVVHLAKENGGFVSPLQIAANSKLTLDQCIHYLDGMCVKRFCIQTETEDGSILYKFNAM